MASKLTVYVMLLAAVAAAYVTLPYLPASWLARSVTALGLDPYAAAAGVNLDALVVLALSLAGLLAVTVLCGLIGGELLNSIRTYHRSLTRET